MMATRLLLEQRQKLLKRESQSQSECLHVEAVLVNFVGYLQRSEGIVVVRLMQWLLSVTVLLLSVNQAS